MNPLENSLRCFRSPPVLLSIGLLLLNNHVLKVVTPSWLTGKLSDFAGLFFFPFLLATLLGTIFRSHLSLQWTGLLAFGLTGVCFALIKTLPFANTLAENGLAFILGYPVQIILGPTDLIALGVLIPGWRLWNSHASKRDRLLPDRAAWVILILAAFATLATSCPPPVPRIDRLAQMDGVLFAHGSSSLNHYTFVSKDYGRTWAIENNPPPGDYHNTTLPQVACDPANLQICYRIMRRDQLEESRDSGLTWHLVGSIPVGRRLTFSVLTRYPGSYPLCGSGEQPDVGPYDLLFTQPVGPGNQTSLVVALGNEGILIGKPDGHWDSVRVDRAEPSWFSKTNSLDELRLIGLLTEICLLIGSLLLLRTVRKSSSVLSKLNNIPTFPSALILLLVAGLVVSVRGAVWIVANFVPLPQSLWLALLEWTPWSLLVLGIVMVLSILPAWMWAARLAQPAARAGAVWSVAAALLLIAFGLSPWLFWTLETPPIFQIDILILLAGGILYRRLSINIEKAVA